MNIRFGGVTIQGYRFNPEKVPLAARRELTTNLLDGMRREFGSLVREVEPSFAMGAWVNHVPQEKFSLRAFQVVQRTQSTLLSRIQDAFHKGPLAKTAPAGMHDQVQLTLLEIQEKATGAADLVIVSRDRHDDDVALVLSEDMMAHMPHAVLKAKGGLQDKAGFIIDRKKTGPIWFEWQLNRQWNLLKANLESRFNAS